jgi:hypothetical protein
LQYPKKTPRVLFSKKITPKNPNHFKKYQDLAIKSQAVSMQNTDRKLATLNRKLGTWLRNIANSLKGFSEFSKFANEIRKIRQTR